MKLTKEQKTQVQKELDTNLNTLRILFAKKAELMNAVNELTLEEREVRGMASVLCGQLGISPEEAVKDFNGREEKRANTKKIVKKKKKKK